MSEAIPPSPALPGASGPLESRPSALERILPPIFGLLAGAFAQLNHLAELRELPTLRGVALRLAVSAALGWALFAAARRVLIARLGALLPPAARRRFGLRHALTYSVFLLTGTGATGFRLPGPVLPLLLGILFVALSARLLLGADPALRQRTLSSFGYLAFLFFVSGMAALIYQVTWQRLLFTGFGVNIESVTLIVTIFMFGLGLGSLLGGRLSRRAPEQLPRLFALCELLVGAFGLISVPLIKAVGALMVRSPPLVTGLTIFALLSVPTLLMGATLPILVAYANEHYRNIGRTVGLLYFVNTLGSAVACFLTADALFVLGGQQSAVLCAAGCNLLVVLLARGYTRAVAAAPTGAPAGGPA